jgi:hypothetical protein
MLASFAFPYTLNTRETITEDMGMECLVCYYTPENDPGHNLVVVPSPYKTHGGSTIAQNVAYFLFPYKKILMQTKSATFSFFVLFVFSPPPAPLPAWVSPGAACRCHGGSTPPPGHPARLQETPEAWMTRRAAGKGHLPIP